MNQKNLFARMISNKREKEMKKSIFYFLCAGLLLTACASDNGGFYGENGDEVYTERTAQYITNENEYAEYAKSKIYYYK